MKSFKIALAGTSLECPIKQNLDQKINDSKPGIWILSCNFGFSSRKSQSHQKPSKTSHFTIQFSSKNLTYFKNLNLLKVVKNMHPQHSQKPYFTNFPAEMFLVAVRKKTFALHHFYTFKNYIVEAIEKQMSIFQYISVRKFLFRRRRKLSSGRGMNNFLKAARCSGLVKCFKIFHFNWDFWNFYYFSAFRYFHQLHWNTDIFQNIAMYIELF